MKPTSFSFSSLLRRLRPRPPSPSPSHNPADDLPFNGVFAFTEGDYRRLLTWELELQRIAFELLDSPQSARALLETSSAFELPSELMSPLHDSESWRVHIAGLHRVAEMGDLPFRLRERLHEMACEIAHLVCSAQAWQLPQPAAGGGSVLLELQRLVDQVRGSLLAAREEPTLTDDRHDAVIASLRWLRHASIRASGGRDQETELEEGLITVLGCLYQGEADPSDEEAAGAYARARTAIRDAFRSRLRVESDVADALAAVEADDADADSGEEASR